MNENIGDDALEMFRQQCCKIANLDNLNSSKHIKNDSVDIGIQIS